MTERTYTALRREADAAAQRIARSIAGHDGWVVETRAGPLKPRPGGPLQLHLLLDDLESIAGRSVGLRLQRAAAGHLLAGERLGAFTDVPTTLEPRLSGCDVELQRMISAVEQSALPVSMWTNEPSWLPVHQLVSTDDAWDRRNLLRAASAVGDQMLLVAAAVDDDAIVAIALAPTVHAVVQPFVRDWSTLGGWWTQARDETSSALRRRRALLHDVRAAGNGPRARRRR